MFDVRNHKGFGHGLKPGTTEDINCASCKREKAEGIVPDITHNTDTPATSRAKTRRIPITGAQKLKLPRQRVGTPTVFRKV